MIRVYELAKKHGIGSKELIEKLEDLDINIKNHMSTLDPKAITLVESEFYPKQEKELEITTEEDIWTDATLLVQEGVTVSSLASILNLQSSQLILQLMKLKVMATIDQHLDYEILSALGNRFGFEVGEKKLQSSAIDNSQSLVPRKSSHGNGHVDQGKASLFESICESNVSQPDVLEHQSEFTNGNVVNRPNRDELDKILQNCYLPAMRRFILQVLKEIPDFERKDSTINEVNIDFKDVPRLIKEHWNLTFSRKFNKIGKEVWSRTGIIKEIRDLVAHPPPSSDIDLDTTRACLYSVAKVLEWINADEEKRTVLTIRDQLINSDNETLNHLSEPVPDNQEVEVEVIDVDLEDGHISNDNELSTSPFKQAQLEVWQQVRGEITRIIDSGAFIALSNGRDGFIHRSEMDWKSINNSSEVVSIGKIVEAMIIGIDHDKMEITLSLKNFNRLEQDYPIGTKINGCVSNLEKFGVFVEIEEGIVGMIHTSETSTNLTEGDEVKVEVKNISPEISTDSRGYPHLNARIDLSLLHSKLKFIGTE